jgi:DNA-binding GntR family transcriptional regulator
MVNAKVSTLEPRRHARTVARLHDQIRQLILDGRLKPGAALSQVQLARRLGVSRTPLREALRMLQEEGLITQERNRRPRVAGFDPNDLEALYATRILISSLGIAMTVPQLTEEDFATLELLLDQMREAGTRDDVDGWEEAHRAFHRTLVSHAGERLQETISRLSDHSKLYRRLWMEAEPHHWTLADEGHRAILRACRLGDRDLAVELLARHFARSSLTVLANAMPEREPSLVRWALQLMLADRKAGTQHRTPRIARAT